MKLTRLTGEKTRKITLCAMLTAIVVVLQLLGSVIRFGPFSVSLVLVPIVIGAAMLGPLYGAWLGLAFAATVLFSGDAALFFAFNVIGTIVTVIAKGVLAGLAAGLVYKLVSRWNRYAAIILAAIVCPVVNTGVFVLGCLIFFWPHLASIAGAVPSIAEAAGSVSDGWKIIFLGLIGGNFFFELGVNLILAPVIARILGVKAEKSTSKVVCGAILTAIGAAALIFSCVKVAKYAGDYHIFEAYTVKTGLNPEQRYVALGLISDAVRLAGLLLLGIGLWEKRKEKRAEAQTEA